MRKKTTIKQEDLDAFHTAMKGTKPLIVRKPKATKPPPPPVKPIRREQSEKNTDFYFSDWEKLEPVDAETFISYARDGISNKILRKLRKGQYNVDAVLDLHRMTVAQAREAVESFFQQCVENEVRVALIIHGKGRQNQPPVLKNKLNHWLRETGIVLAFCSAAPAHGSRGAIYALLKRTSERNDSD